MRINIIVPDELLEKIDERAKKMNVSRTAYMNMTISKQIEAEDTMANMPETLSTLERLLNETKVISANQQQLAKKRAR